MLSDESLKPEVPAPDKKLERAFILEYLRSKGHTLETLHALPEAEAKQLMAEASLYASTRLTEVEARAHFVQEVHGTVSSIEHEHG